MPGNKKIVCVDPAFDPCKKLSFFNQMPNTLNYTIRNVLSGSGEPVTLSTPWIASTFTGSVFKPYITTINLYRDGDYEEPVIQATLPRPIRKSDKINMRFKIKLDL